MKNIHDDDYKAITELKDVIVSELGHLTLQMADKSVDSLAPVGDPVQESSFGVIFSKRC